MVCVYCRSFCITCINKEQGNTLVEREENCALFSDEKQMFSNKSNRKYQKVQYSSVINHEKGGDRPSVRPQSNTLSVESTSLSQELGNFSNLSSNGEIGDTSHSHLNSRRLMGSKHSSASTDVEVIDEISCPENYSKTFSPTKSVSRSEIKENEKINCSGSETEGERTPVKDGRDRFRDINIIDKKPSRSKCNQTLENVKYINSQGDYHSSDPMQCQKESKILKRERVKSKLSLNKIGYENQSKSSEKESDKVENSECMNISNNDEDTPISRRTRRGRKPKMSSPEEARRHDCKKKKFYHARKQKNISKETLSSSKLSEKKDMCLVNISITLYYFQSLHLRFFQSCSQCNEHFSLNSELTDHLMRKHCIIVCRFMTS